MKRLIVLSFALLAVVACEDGSLETLGPAGAGDRIQQAPSFSHTAGSPASCLDEALDPAYYPESSWSPCDALTTGNEFFNLLAPGRSTTVDGLGPLAVDLLPYVKVDVVCISDDLLPGDEIVWPDGVTRTHTGDCRDFQPNVQIIDGSYFQAKFRTNKKQDPANAVYQVLISLDIGNGYLLGGRTVAKVDEPGLDSPQDDRLFITQNGSTDPINFHISSALTDCPTDAPIEVTCLITNEGGTLRVFDPNGTVTSSLNIGADNGLNVFTLALTECGQLDVDLPKFGCAVEITSETFDAAVDGLLNESSVTICQDLSGLTADQIAAVRVAQADAQGQTILPEIPAGDVTAECGAGLASLDVRRGLWANALAGVSDFLGVRSLDAAVGISKGGGGDIGRLSEVQLVLPAKTDVIAESLPDGPVRLGDQVPVDLQTWTGNDAVAPGTVLRVFGDGTLECPTTPPAGTNTVCVDDGSAGPGDVVVATGELGAQILFTPGVVGTAYVDVLGCGVAVPGSSDAVAPTPNPFNVLGVLNGADGCDRLRTDETGPHNGPAAGLDPFVDATNEVAINDRRFRIPITVCSPLTTPEAIDGVRESAWDCAESLQFDVNLRGGGKDQPQATFLWMNDGVNLYTAVLLPRDQDETDTSLYFEFDLGDPDGHPGTAIRDQADAGDDLIGVVRDKDGTHFIDSYVDSGCAGSNGTSVCDPAVAETQAEVAGGVAGPGVAATVGAAVNGQYMFYEVAHPLCSANAVEGGVLMDFCIPNEVRGDELADLGVFLRLAIGKGAQGDTKAPDFRVYYPLVIN